MVLKSILVTAVSVLLMASNLAMAAGYRPGDFFSLDLLKAALSSNPIGPAAHFEQIPIEANTASDIAEAPEAEQVEHVHARKSRHIAGSRHGVRTAPRIAHPKLVRRHGNPLDAQASDTRVQVWPCKSGGICNWRRSRR